MNNRNPSVVTSLLRKCFVVLVVVLLIGCNAKPKKEDASVDIILIGGGIMSATLGSMLNDLDENLKIEVFERLPDVALESTSAWNNAGTGHAAFAELNYTPEAADGTINLKKAIEVSEAFEMSKEYWAYLVSKGSVKPEQFIRSVPHMSLVWGDDNVSFLKRRHEAMIKHPLFVGMEYSENHYEIKTWAPLLIEGRNPQQKIAATRMKGGVDVNFGALTQAIFNNLKNAPNFHLHLKHDVNDIIRNDDMSWTVVVTDTARNQKKSIRAKFVFIGAGGGALSLLQKSGIKEAHGFGGFPVGGAWLISHREDLIARHDVKAYGKAAVGSPPMSVPHLDTRFIDGKKALLFGPFATFSTKFLKSGSWTDLLVSVSLNNMVPMLEVGIRNLDLVRYLIGQVMLSKEEQIESLREYMPNARAEDWCYEHAGQRVQIIKNDTEKGGGTLQFGTELISADDKSLVALLGASPGASTAVQAMMKVVEMSFSEKLATAAWQNKIKEMIPSYGEKLAENESLIIKVRERNREILALED